METSQEIAPIDQFSSELASRADEIANILPQHVDQAAFVSTAIIAVKHNPELLSVDRKSLHQAVTEAAEDGLKPDGREGVITIYKEKRKVRRGNVMVEDWVPVANWNPMLYGIRKRALEVCGIIINAEVVYEHDAYEECQGDDPKIVHKPARGRERGAPMLVYAIFKKGSDVLHREVMEAADVEKVKSMSKQQGGLLWTKFWTEAWKKVAVRRGIKTVPSVPEFERIVKREDRDFDFDRGQKVITAQAATVAVVKDAVSATTANAVTDITVDFGAGAEIVPIGQAKDRILGHLMTLGTVDAIKAWCAKQQPGRQMTGHHQLALDIKRSIEGLVRGMRERAAVTQDVARRTAEDVEADDASTGRSDPPSAGRPATYLDAKGA